MRRKERPGMARMALKGDLMMVMGAWMSCDTEVQVRSRSEGWARVRRSIGEEGALS